MSRPLTCDNCQQVIDSSVPPVKVALNGTPPPEFEGLERDEMALLSQLMQQMGAGQPVKQQLLDFCSTLCLAMWAWQHATNLPLRTSSEGDYAYEDDRTGG